MLFLNIFPHKVLFPPFYFLMGNNSNILTKHKTYTLRLKNSRFLKTPKGIMKKKKQGGPFDGICPGDFFALSLSLLGGGLRGPIFSFPLFLGVSKTKTK